MLDSITSLALQRPLRIMAEDLNMPMLEVSDFETQLNEPFISDKTGKYTVNIRAQLVEILLQKARLCVLVNNSLSLNCTLTAWGNRSPSFNIIVASLSLAEWAEQLPSNCRYHLAEGENFHPSSDIILQNLFLHMLYHIILMSLHDLFLRSKRNTLCQLQNMPGNCVRECVRRVARIITSLSQCHQKTPSSNSGVATLLDSMAHNLEELMGNDVELWSECDFGYQVCIQALPGFRQSTYESDPSIACCSTAIECMHFTANQYIEHNASNKLDERSSHHEDRSISQPEGDKDKALEDGEFRLEDWLEL
jgi:hypothetical protein